MIVLGAQWGALALKAFVVTVALHWPETALTLISCFYSEQRIPLVGVIGALYFKSLI